MLLGFLLVGLGFGFGFLLVGFGFGVRFGFDRLFGQKINHLLLKDSVAKLLDRNWRRLRRASHGSAR